MKRTIIISLLCALVVNTGLAAAQPERRIQNLRDMCRTVVAQDPNFIHNALPVLHEQAPGCEGIIVPAKRINTALLNRIFLQSRELQGHRALVRSVAFSPDGTTLASASGDRTVHFWDAVTLLRQHAIQNSQNEGEGSRLRQDYDGQAGACRHTLQNYTDDMFSVALSPDGTTRALTTLGYTVDLQNATTDAPLRTLQGHTGPVRSVAFSPDGTTLASASFDGTVRLWDTATGTCLHILRSKLSGPVRSVAFSPDGTTLASTSDYITVRLWNPVTGACRHILQGNGQRINTVTFSPDGATLASGTDDGTVLLWNAATGTHLHTLEGHTSRITSIALSPDGKALASASDYSTVHLWTDYQHDLQTITDFDEQRFLLEAAEDWLSKNWSERLLFRKGTGRPHQVSANNPIYLRLIERFPFLNNPQLFTVIQPNEHAGIPTCSSSDNTPASSNEPVASTHNTPIIATGLTAAACALGAYLWNVYTSQ